MRSPRRLRLAEQLESRLLMAADVREGLGEGQFEGHGAGCACPSCASGCHLIGDGHFIGDGHDHSNDELMFDAFGNGYYIDPLPKQLDVSPFGAALPADVEDADDDVPIPMAADGDLTVPIYHSNPDSLKKIYLDFDGEIVNQTSWNSSNNNQTIHARAYSVDDDIFTFNQEELDRIYEIWERVSEDYSPFDVDITTEDPGTDFFRRGGQGIRVIISTNVDDSRLGGTDNAWFGQAGGVGYVNSWNWQSDTPVWVFSNLLGNGVKKVSEAAAHEVGHALGLSHDGVSGGTSYFEGHGNWAPIMGNAYHRDVTQWSRGEYDGAQNLENDLAIITGKVPYRFDDHSNDPNEFSNPTPLIVEGDTLSASGIIEQGNDVDAFSFTVGPGAGLVDFSFEPFHNGPNLNIRARLHASNGVVLFESNPEGDLAASIQTTLDSGDYYLAVTGVGEGDPGTDGYSQYASLGQYTIRGTIESNPGDFNADTVVDASDIDAMRVAILGSSDDVAYDLNGDGLVSKLDFDEMIYNILGTNYGDANLDGVVDATDFTIWSANRFSVGTGWATGDFNGDFVTDGSDFNLWSEFRFDAALSLAHGPTGNSIVSGLHRRIPKAALSTATRTNAVHFETNSSANAELMDLTDQDSRGSMAVSPRLNYNSITAMRRDPTNGHQIVNEDEPGRDGPRTSFGQRVTIMRRWTGSRRFVHRQTSAFSAVDSTHLDVVVDAVFDQFARLRTRTS